MGEILQLDYYYGIEAEQFSFYRVPRLLIKDERFKKLSSDAKLLYEIERFCICFFYCNNFWSQRPEVERKRNEQKKYEEIIACCYCCGNCDKNSKRHYESEKAERKHSC